jgi:hypothetical protein
VYNQRLQNLAVTLDKVTSFSNFVMLRSFLVLLSSFHLNFFTKTSVRTHETVFWCDGLALVIL